MQLAFVVYLLFSINKSSGQTSTSKHLSFETSLPVKVLKVGDKVPDYFFKDMMNYKLRSAKLSDFNNKHIILDFWSVWCGDCVELLPKIEELQKIHNDSLQFLGIAFEFIAGETKKFLSKHKNSNKEITLPTAIIDTNKDSSFIQLFQVSGLPHEVWINDEGIITNITDQFAVNNENIQRFLKNEPIKAFEKKLKYFLKDDDDFLINKSQFNRTSGSAFSNYLDTLWSTDSRNVIPPGVNSIDRVFFINTTLENLYLNAYGWIHDSFFKDPNRNKRIVVTPKSQYKTWREINPNSTAIEMNDFLFNNLFCYELILNGKQSLSTAATKMINDLDNYFNYNSRFSESDLMVYDLAIDSNTKFIESVSKNKNIIIRNDTIFLSGYSRNEFISFLNSKVKEYIINDDTSKDDVKLDMAIPVRYKSVDELNQILGQKGMKLFSCFKKMKLLFLEKKQL